MHTQYFTKLELTIIVTRAIQPVATRSQSPYLHKPVSSCHYDVILIMTSRAFRSPRSHYDVILIMTSFATEPATPTVTDVRTYVPTDTLPRLNK